MKELDEERFQCSKQLVHIIKLQYTLVCDLWNAGVAMTFVRPEEDCEIDIVNSRRI